MTLTVASYNVHGCVGIDRREDPPRIARVLRELDADIIALQELDNYQHDGTWCRHIDYMSQQLSMESVAGPTLWRDRGEYGIAILTRLPVRASQRHEISVRLREPRCVLECELVHGDRSLRVVATHLGLRVQERHRQVQLLANLLAQAEPVMPTVLLGDFNEWLRRSRPIRRIERVMGHAPSVRSFPARWPVLALDRIWVRPVSHLRSLQAVSTIDSRIASDHLPIRAILDL